MSRLRGVCRDCGRDFTLRADGTLRGHIDGGPGYGGYGAPQWCSGAWQPPRVPDPPAVPPPETWLG